MVPQQVLDNRFLRLLAAPVRRAEAPHRDSLELRCRQRLQPAFKGSPRVTVAAAAATAAAADAARLLNNLRRRVRRVEVCGVRVPHVHSVEAAGHERAGAARRRPHTAHRVARKRPVVSEACPGVHVPHGNDAAETHRVQELVARRQRHRRDPVWVVLQRAEHFPRLCAPHAHRLAVVRVQASAAPGRDQAPRRRVVQRRDALACVAEHAQLASGLPRRVRAPPVGRHGEAADVVEVRPRHDGALPVRRVPNRARVLRHHPQPVRRRGQEHVVDVHVVHRPLQDGDVRPARRLPHLDAARLVRRRRRRPRHGARVHQLAARRHRDREHPRAVQQRPHALPGRRVPHLRGAVAAGGVRLAAGLGAGDGVDEAGVAGVHARRAQPRQADGDGVAALQAEGLHRVAVDFLDPRAALPELDARGGACGCTAVEARDLLLQRGDSVLRGDVHCSNVAGREELNLDVHWCVGRARRGGGEEGGREGRRWLVGGGGGGGSVGVEGEKER
eukprot:Rhum_TRINITY_DN10284_c0_g1::Rhum_TRINITY_DN10284_c0_g1_i1::g.37700::m.37700